MKKTVNMLFLTVAFATVLVSCKKDEISAPDSLEGTSWLYEESEKEDGVESGAGVEIDFTSATKGTINILMGGISEEEIFIAGWEAGGFTYTYSKPTLKITVNGETSTGKIAGNKLTIEGVVFVKEEE